MESSKLNEEINRGPEGCVCGGGGGGGGGRGSCIRTQRITDLVQLQCHTFLHLLSIVFSFSFFFFSSSFVCGMKNKL